MNTDSIQWTQVRVPSDYDAAGAFCPLADDCAGGVEVACTGSTVGSSVFIVWYDFYRVSLASIAERGDCDHRFSDSESVLSGGSTRIAPRYWNCLDCQPRKICMSEGFV